MLTLNDGRSELWQWDTGRKLTVDADCTQVHFSNKFFGRSVDVDVFDGTAEIPDVLLQADKELLVWAFVGTAENGYTKISKVFKVNKRNKPADYVFTPTEQTTLDEIKERLDRIEEGQDPDAIKNAVDEYLANNPIQVKEKDPTVPDWAKQPTKPKYTAQEVGAVATVNGTAPDENGNVEIEIPEGGAGSGLTTAQINALDGMFKVCAFTKPDVSAEYNAFKTAFGIGGEDEPDVPDVPDVPDEPDEPEKTLTSISAVYSGGSVTAGTAVSELTGIVVTAHYSDGTSEAVTGYTLSGTIAEGSNTITVSYGGKTTTFTVTGTAESGGDEPETGVSNETTWTDGVTYTFDWVENEYVSDGDGVFKKYEGWNRSPMLYCAGASRIDFVGANSQQANYNALYDADKQYVQEFRPSANGYIDIPEGAVYFAVSGPSSVTQNFTATPSA